MRTYRPGKLQRLLGIEGSLFESGLKRLEKSTGNSAVDVRLIADMISKSHQVMRKLGLDTSNTTGQELYASLIALIKQNKAEQILAETDYVLVEIDDKVVSLNLYDVIENWHHQLDYNHQSTMHGRRSLGGEILNRYTNHSMTNDITTHEIAKSIGLLR